MPALVRTKAELEVAAPKPRVAVPEGLGPVLRQIVEQEQGDLIAAIREEERAAARADAAQRVAAAEESFQKAEERARALSESTSRVDAAAGKVEAAAGAMAERIAERLTAAVDERMADIVEALSILRGDVAKLQKKPAPATKWVLGKVERQDGQIVYAEFVRAQK